MGGTASVDNSKTTDSSYNSDTSYASASNKSAAANKGGTASVDNSITLGSIAANVAKLDGTVSNNTVTVGGDNATYTASNTIDNGSFQNSAGISVVAQNLGDNSLIQQNVNVQANLTLK